MLTPLIVEIRQRLKPRQSFRQNNSILWLSDHSLWGGWLMTALGQKQTF
jgi:hypothetical protein